jgi:hypothetical protein
MFSSGIKVSQPGMPEEGDFVASRSAGMRHSPEETRMPEPDIDPLVKTVVEDRAHAINQMIMDARLAETPFPREAATRAAQTGCY